DALLIHAAALVDGNTPAALLANAAMAMQVAQWAKQVGIGFCVMASSVSVYGDCSHAAGKTEPAPANLYGLGKLTAEGVWRVFLPARKMAIVGLAGIWGWQKSPTLFWNRLLLAAAGGPTTPAVHRRKSRRNYLCAPEAAQCLLGLGRRRQSGLFVAAGLCALDTAE